MMQGAPVLQRHPDHGTLGGFRRLTDGLRHLARLAMPEADPAALVAHDHKRREAEAPTALHHLGDAVDVHELVDELAVAVFTLAGITCHGSSFLEFEAALAGRLGKRLHAPMIEIPAAVKDHLLDALLESALGDELADDGGRGNIVALGRSAALTAFARTRRGNGLVSAIVDELGIDMPARTIDREARTPTAHLPDVIAHSAATAFKEVCLFGHIRLLLLAFFAANTLARIFHTLALIRLRRTIAADLGRHLSHKLLVDPGDADHGRLFAHDSDSSRNRIGHVVRKAQLQLQILALHRRAVADAGNFQLFAEPFRHPADEIV